MLARLSLPALLAAAAVLSSGCAATTDSSKDFKGPARDVAQVVEDYQDAARSSDEDKICNRLLAAALVKQIEAAGHDGKGSCLSRVKDTLRDVDTYELKVQKVDVSGTSATAVVRSEGGSDPHTQTLRLVKEGTPGTWKISAVG